MSTCCVSLCCFMLSCEASCPPVRSIRGWVSWCTYIDTVQNEQKSQSIPCSLYVLSVFLRLPIVGTPAGQPQLPTCQTSFLYPRITSYLGLSSTLLHFRRLCSRQRMSRVVSRYKAGRHAGILPPTLKFKVPSPSSMAREVFRVLYWAWICSALRFLSCVAGLTRYNFLMCADIVLRERARRGGN